MASWPLEPLLYMYWIWEQFSPLTPNHTLLPFLAFSLFKPQKEPGCNIYLLKFQDREISEQMLWNDSEGFTSADVDIAVTILEKGGRQWGRDNKCLLFKWLSLVGNLLCSNRKLKTGGRCSLFQVTWAWALSWWW